LRVSSPSGRAYEPGMRTGAWRKMRVNLGQEFVIGGHTPSAKNFDAMVIGYYEAGKNAVGSLCLSRSVPAKRTRGRIASAAFPDSRKVALSLIE